MPHQRKLIRDAVLLAIKGVSPSFNTEADGRVFNNRTAVWPVRLLELGPCISIYAVDEESVGDLEASPKQLKRKLQLAIEAAVIAGPGGDVDDAIDAICLEIEDAMHIDPTFGGVCSESDYQSTAIEVSSEGSTEIGNVRLVYDVTYYTDAVSEDEEATLDDLLLLKANIDQEGVQHVDDEQLAEVSFADPTVYLDVGIERPEEHDDPQENTFSIADLLEAGEELWVDATATTTEGLEELDHVVEISHVATGALIRTRSITPVDGRILDSLNAADLGALTLLGYFVLEVKDNDDTVFDTLHFTLNA